METSNIGKWLVSFNPVPEECRARLICFHWAGGNGNAFKPWSRLMKFDGIDVRAMMLPGRLSRRKESFATSVGEIVERMADCMKELGLLGDAQPPTIFFGHSFGGIIAYELANLLKSKGALTVSHLIISSTNNPQVLTNKSLAEDSEAKKFHKLSDDELLNEILIHGGLPKGVHIDLLRMSLPIIRADYRVLETYTHIPAVEGHALYSGPVTVYGGGNDQGDISAESLKGWSKYVSSPERFSIYMFPEGSHFYFMENKHEDEVRSSVTNICLNS